MTDAKPLITPEPPLVEASRRLHKTNGFGGTALCAEAARAAVPSAWTIVEEIAEKSPYPTLTKARMAILMY